MKWKCLFLSFFLCNTVIAELVYDQMIHPKNPEQFECMLLGDTYYGEKYQDDLKSQHAPYIDLTNEQGYDYSIANFMNILENSDLNIANLETAITSKIHSPLLELGKEYIHYGNIEFTPAALKRHHIHVVSLANNHALDFGTDVYYQTVTKLREFGIPYFGVGTNLNNALKPYLFKVNFQNGTEFKVAIIGALQERSDYFRSKFDFYANGQRPGAGILNPDRIKQVVDNLRKIDKNIFIILFPHWGRDYEKENSTQRNLNRLWKKMGINAVIGHGPHVAQKIEMQGDTLTAFSIGNFIFNSPGRYKVKNADGHGLMLKLKKSANTNNVLFQFYPIFVDNKIVNFKQRFFYPAEFKKMVVDFKINKNPNVIIASEPDQYGWSFAFQMPWP